ncbi:hypothetical protein [Spirillospora sp. NPDC029432]|uniref:hypothetical protein n=1 Tax=Spirillospora sp. NPDC029432 TaxID=3154599 RepID=UPI0034550DF0
MGDRTTETGPLAVLGDFLTACGFTVERDAGGLRVSNPQVRGCCTVVSDTVTCRERAEDGGRMWFWTSWGWPIAPADRVTDAALRVLEYLGERSHGAGR